MPHSDLNISRADLLKAAAALAIENFEVHTPPPNMLGAGIVLAAYRPGDGEGFMLSAAEVRLVAQHGIAALDPHNQGDDVPRWQRPDAKNRERAYVEAALARAIAEVSTAPVGNRNNVLARAAYGLGRLEALGLDLEKALQELIQAAAAAGLEVREAETTARRALAKGALNPLELPDREPQKSQRGQWHKKSGWEVE
ncbi:hypothetical protein [Meiothermus sp. CFH 77666]|uniref:hypothetical protein n=1 Tax=Meiothermus sp. CFH 77666 TaxID=2817942 RepID=UPI001AA0ABA0|nr:hypothetical protein [Meiothermus sp. CFH 77666]MBO1436083.1 hypothetical protein [Meiothermus sp. CFH 77666]